MFTGLVEEIGTINKRSESSGNILLEIIAPESASKVHANDSIAVNGVCQTIIHASDDSFEVCAVAETLKKTNLRLLKKGGLVNLELPLQLNERLDGHIVLGHVDTTVPIVAFEQRGENRMLSVQVPQDSLKYIIPVGSITLDGISLTVANIDGDIVTIAIIPHTYEHTIVKNYTVGTLVNVEFDVLGKYIERLLTTTTPSSNLNGLTQDYLKHLGY